MSAARLEPVLWDIFEEHLDEAAFLGAQWERALDSPLVDLSGLATGLERRLDAHLGALLLGGPRIVDTLLLPAICDGEPGPCLAAALVLLASPVPGQAEAVLTAWSQATGPRRRALTRALTLAPRAPQRPELRAALTASEASRRAAAIDVLGFHRVLQPQDIDALRGDPEPTVREALVRAAGRDPTLDLRPLVRDELSAPTTDRLTAALTSAAILNLPELPAACRAALARPDAAGDRAHLLLALTADDLTPLLTGTRRAAVHALGFTGNFAAAERCVHCITHGIHPALAFEAFTGMISTTLPHLPAPDVDALPDLADDDLTADIATTPEDDLPLPDPAAIQTWWRQHHDTLPRPRLPGHADAPATLLAELRRASMRRCQTLALRLAIVSAGHTQLETRASARRQLTTLARLF